MRQLAEETGRSKSSIATDLRRARREERLRLGEASSDPHADPPPMSPREIIEDIARNAKDARSRLSAAKELQRISEAGTWNVTLPDDDEHLYIYVTGEEADAFRRKVPGAKVDVVPVPGSGGLEGTKLVRPHVPDGEDPADYGLITVFPPLPDGPPPDYPEQAEDPEPEHEPASDDPDAGLERDPV